MRPFAILGPISLLALLGACDPRGEKTDGDVERGEGEEAVAQAETEMVESKPTEPEPGAPERAAPKAVEPKADEQDETEPKAVERGEAEPKVAGVGPLGFDPPDGPGGKLPFEPLAKPDEEPETPGAYWNFGWTRDGSEFAWCMNDASDDGGECYLVNEKGKTEKTFEPDEWDAMAKKKGPFFRGSETWAYPGVTITARREGPKLSVGGRAASETSGGKIDLFTHEYDPEMYFEGEGDVGIGYVAVSQDGKWMAIASVARLGFTDEQTEVDIIGTEAFAAAVYGAHGWAGFRAKKYEDAAKWFGEAARVSQAWKHPYNEACARALGELEGTEAALKLAIERGGDPVKKKANKDKDLANVRDEAWFKSLVG